MVRPSARLAPEKGLHVLVDAFIDLHRNQRVADVRLEIAGWLGKQHEPYWQAQQQKIEAVGLGQHVNYWGSVDRKAKLEFLDSIDVLCVPTTYAEPKGLFVLEALAAGVPYLQPAHGAFPELHSRVGGGYLFDPENPHELSERLVEALSDIPASRRLGAVGREYIFEHATTDRAAEKLEATLRRLINSASVDRTQADAVRK
ncbi:MAG: glycosyltransferase family 4 protein [Pirellulaceae bacterium]